MTAAFAAKLPSSIGTLLHHPVFSAFCCLGGKSAFSKYLRPQIS
jgi:hypothetical protein